MLWGFLCPLGLCGVVWPSAHLRHSLTRISTHLALLAPSQKATSLCILAGTHFLLAGSGGGGRPEFKLPPPSPSSRTHQRLSPVASSKSSGSAHTLPEASEVGSDRYSMDEDHEDQEMARLELERTGGKKVGGAKACFL